MCFVCVCVLSRLFSLIKKNESKAATIIKSYVRGYLTRKQTQHDQQQHQLFDEDSNIDQFRQRSQITEVNTLVGY